MKDNEAAEGLPEEKKKGGKGRAFPVITAILLVIMIAVFCTTAIFAYRSDKETANKLDSLTETLDKFLNDLNAEEETREDDVVIMDEFTIRSTLPISDAYKSGDTSALSDREKETLAMASAVLDENITDGMTDYEKEKAVYTWLTTELGNETSHLTVIHNDVSESDNPYGVLKYRSAVCVGYATTFRLFMQMMGIECKVIHSLDCIHSWDLVKLEDDWYHVDCYMDSDVGGFRNFNMNDSLAAASHQWDKDFFPAAKGDKYVYAMTVLKELDDFYDMPAWVKGMIDAGEKVGSCCFKDRITDATEASAAAMTETLFNTLCNSVLYCDHSFEYSWSEHDEYGYVLTLYITYPENGDEPDDNDVDPEVYEKVNGLISDAFGEDVFEQVDWGSNDGEYGFTPETTGPKG